MGSGVPPMADSARIVAPAGELDVASSRAIGSELSQAAGDATRPLVVDLSDVTLMDSSALGAIVQAHLRMRRQGRTMAVVVPPGSAAAALLNVTHTGGQLPLHSTREDALAALRDRAATPAHSAGAGASTDRAAAADTSTDRPPS
jgi:anti-anti-sigma factor